MKEKNGAIFLRRFWFWVMPLLVLFILLQGCDKGIDVASFPRSADALENGYQALYEKLNVGDKLIDTLNSNLIVNYLPEWEKSREYQKNDSSHHRIVPLKPVVTTGGIAKVANVISDFPFLFIVNGKQFYFGRFFSSAYSEGQVVNMDSVFVNGEMELTEVFTNKIIKYRYEGGAGEYIRPSVQARQATGRNLQSRYELRCETEITCTWYADCQGGLYLATSPSGTCIQPPSTTPCDYSAPWQRSTDIRREVCQNVWIPDPIDPGVPGGGGPPTNEDNKTEKEKILRDLKLSDCQGVKKANEIAKDIKIRNAINAIKSKTKEWGVELKLADPNDPNSLTVGAPYTDSRSSVVNLTPSWDQRQGYTIGFIHNHPNGGSPSPSDIFNAAVDLVTMAGQQNIPADQLSLYLNNFVSIVVSGDYIYTITVKEAQTFAYMTREFEGSRQVKENLRYRESIEKYLEDNNIQNPSRTQMQTAGESALLKLFGNMFNLSKQKINEIEKNQSVQRSADGSINTKNPCNP
ncbi:hypothetical protein [Sphingobacterium bambusae]|uniref:MPN domain-containing protein n=1 Tax=Sphingobacterium bambusae TaxID=662858 RepID=A0ABW6BJ88_9SPHI|nr:hypothetical protein [Sphingobacterium bambusae]WPL49710.1 hypothetical protein SCB77_04495 [Sphingobacterium bambusae]